MDRRVSEFFIFQFCWYNYIPMFRGGEARDWVSCTLTNQYYNSLSTDVTTAGTTQMPNHWWKSCGRLHSVIAYLQTVENILNSVFCAHNSKTSQWNPFYYPIVTGILRYNVGFRGILNFRKFKEAPAKSYIQNFFNFCQELYQFVQFLLL